MSILNSLFVGVDVSKNTNQICACNFNSDYFFNQNFDNSVFETETVINMINDVMLQNKLTHIIIALESTSVYFFHIANAFSSSDILNKFHLEVYAINAKVIHNYSKSFVSHSKNDPKDAKLIADFARVGRCKDHKPWRGAQLVALQRVTRHRYHLAQQLTREKNYALNNIFLKFNKLENKNGPGDEVNPFSDIFGATSTSVLLDFLSPEDIVQMPLEDLVEYVNTKGKRRFSNPENTAKLLKQCALDSYRLDRVSYDAINIALASSLRMISMLKRELKDIEKQITSFVKALDNNAYLSLTSISGVGPVSAAGIIAEIGSTDAFSSNDKLAKFAGLTWTDNSSGKIVSENNELTRTGNKYLRYYITQAANSCRKHDSIYSNYYSKKFNESLTHKHKRALALTSRKFVKLIYSLLRNNQLYSIKRDNDQHK